MVKNVGTPRNISRQMASSGSYRTLCLQREKKKKSPWVLIMKPKSKTGGRKKRNDKEAFPQNRLDFTEGDKGS